MIDDADKMRVRALADWAERRAGCAESVPIRETTCAEIGGDARADGPLDKPPQPPA